MHSPSAPHPLLGLQLLALVALAPGATAAQTPAPGEVPAPAAPAAPPVAQELADEGPTVLAGERLDPSAFGPAVIEDMATVVRREEERGLEHGPDPKARNGAQGEWEVPGMRWIRNPRSGTRHVINRWGDTRMGIGFGREVDLVGTWVAGQGTLGVWTDGLQVVGYRDGEEVARTEWFEDIGFEPTWLALDLEDVDRVELLARPVIQGSGWYALDDLTFDVAGETDTPERVVLDFEDLDFGTRLTGSGYAGLDWEIGSGDFVQTVREMPPPQVPPGVDVRPEADAGGQGSSKLLGNGTTPRLVQEFDGPRFGDAGSGGVAPPDTCGSVGPTHFVSAVNSNLSIYLKSTGQRLVNVSLGGFLGGGAGDPRVTYDPHHDRWVVLATDFSTLVHVAYSLTGDPTGAWFKTSINVSQGADAGKWPDYPTLGVDANGIYFAAYMVTGSNQMSIWAIDKAPLLAATPSLGTVTAWRQLPWEGAIQPCVTHGDSGGVYLVSRRSSQSLRLRQITGPLTAPSLVQVGVPAAPSHSSPPDAPQKGTIARLDSLDYRPMNAVYRNGSVWTAHSVTVAGRAGVRWYEIDAATATTLQAGTISDDSLHFYIPSIAVNAQDDVLLGFSGSDESTYAGAWITGRRASDPPGVTGPPLLYRPGQGPYTQLTSSGTNRWGDYSLTSVDPADDESFWTIQEYAPANNIWKTHIAQADFACTTSTYCSGKITSKLCSPAMTSTGTPLLALAPFFEVRAKAMDPKVNGIMFFGLSGTAATPFQGGTLCVGSPVHRLPGRNSGGTSACSGSIAYTLAEILAAPGGNQIGAGSRVYVQAWARDTGDAFGSSLSDALTFEVCP